jgi:hypothetical protein
MNMNIRKDYVKLAIVALSGASMLVLAMNPVSAEPLPDGASVQLVGDYGYYGGYGYGHGYYGHGYGYGHSYYGHGYGYGNGYGGYGNGYGYGYGHGYGWGY